MKYEKAKQRHQELKRIVLTHYGNGKLACVRCGFSDIRALSIDHIQGGGSHSNLKRSSLYSFLQDNGYPEGYQALCMNCQFIKRFENREDYWHAQRRLERLNELKKEAQKPYLRASPKYFRRYINKLDHLVFTIQQLEIAFGIGVPSKEYNRLTTFLTRATQTKELRRIGQGEYERVVKGVNTY